MDKPFNLKLFTIRLVFNFYKVIIGTVVGALLIGVSYYLVNVTFGDAPDYEGRVIAHEEYRVDEYGNQSDYINDYTWNEWVRTDSFTDILSDSLDSKYSSDELKTMLSADVPADLRTVYVYVTGKDAGAVTEVTNKVPDALLSFSSELYEVAETEIMDVKEATVKSRDVRVANAFILGAVLGFIISILIMAGLYILDDSVYIPLLFEEEYGIGMTLEGTEEGTIIEIDKSIPEIPDIESDEAVILKITSGAHNGKIIDYVVNEVEKQGMEVSGAVLMNPDRKLIKAYFATSKFPNPFMK